MYSRLYLRTERQIQSLGFFYEISMKQFFIIALGILSINGCALKNDTIVETTMPPFIIEASVFPTVIDFGKISTINSVIDTAVSGYAFVKDDDGLADISTVNYTVVSPDGAVLISGQQLRDDGAQTDPVAGDGKYNGRIALPLPSNILGNYTIQIQAIDNAGFKSNVFALPIKIMRSTNHAPSISNIIAPDTVFVPTDSTIVDFIKVSVAVSDDEGLSDIASVTLTSQREDSTVAGVFPLYDDGGKIIQPTFNWVSGDDAANDGRYTLLIPITSKTQRNIYRDFIFAARDRSGAFSKSLTKRVYLK